MWIFKTRLKPKEIDFYHHGLNIVASISAIQWHAQIEVREWGIKHLSIEVPDQIITVSYLDDEDELQPGKEMDIDVELHNVKVRYMPHDGIPNGGIPEISMKHLMIDLSHNRFEAEF